MGKVILICGKICCGKSWYAKNLKDSLNGIILSTDEATFDLINNEQGDFYDVFAQRVNRYLRKKAAEIVQAGTNVILDWGFWTKAERIEISQYFINLGVQIEWHYIDVSDEKWKQQIEERNKRVKEGMGGSDFYLDDGLMKKLMGLFEAPDKSEINVWHVNG